MLIDAWAPGLQASRVVSSGPRALFPCGVVVGSSFPRPRASALSVVPSGSCTYPPRSCGGVEGLLGSAAGVGRVGLSGLLMLSLLLCCESDTVLCRTVFYINIVCCLGMGLSLLIIERRACACDCI